MDQEKNVEVVEKETVDAVKKAEYSVEELKAEIAKSMQEAQAKAAILADVADKKVAEEALVLNDKLQELEGKAERKFKEAEGEAEGFVEKAKLYVPENKESIVNIGVAIAICVLTLALVPDVFLALFIGLIIYTQFLSMSEQAAARERIEKIADQIKRHF